MGIHERHEAGIDRQRMRDEDGPGRLGFIPNGQITIGGQKFWRIDNLDKNRAGVEMLQKPSLLLLCEDHPNPQDICDLLMSE